MIEDQQRVYSKLILFLHVLFLFVRNAVMHYPVDTIVVVQTFQFSVKDVLFPNCMECYAT